jgi:hypothetical protein
MIGTGGSPPGCRPRGAGKLFPVGNGWFVAGMRLRPRLLVVVIADHDVQGGLLG